MDTKDIIITIVLGIVSGVVGRAFAKWFYRKMGWPWEKKKQLSENDINE